MLEAGHGWKVLGRGTDAKAMIARTSSTPTVRNSFTMVSTVSPWARCPRMTGWPPQMLGSRAM